MEDKCNKSNLNPLKRLADSMPRTKTGLKIVAGLLTVTFLTAQISWAAELELRQAVSPQPVISADSIEPVERLLKGSVQIPKKNALISSIEFLEDAMPLAKAEGADSRGNEEAVLSDLSDVEQTILPASQQRSEGALNYESERYSFEEALDQLRPEYASAVLLKSLNADDVRKMTRLPFEVSLVVLHGEIVVFTSGNSDEIGVTPAAKQLLTHSHRDGRLW